MRTLLLLFFCLFLCLVINADDIRWEFDQFKSQLEGQHAALSLEIAQLKNDVKKLKYQCPRGWERFGDSCYYRSTEKKTWQQSREFCQNQPGADLVVITSREEQVFVNSFPFLAGGVWIGLTDREREGVWKWVNGTPLTAPTYWRSGEPNDRGGEDCVMFYGGLPSTWYDYPCGNTAYWVCELVF